MDSRPFLLVRIVLPVIVLAALGISPVPREVSELLARAGEVEKAGRPGQAALLLERVAGQQPYRQLDERIARNYVHAGDYERAAQYFTLADQDSHLSASGLAEWADVLERSGEEEAAVSLWRRAVAGPGAAEAQQRLALLLRKRGEFAAALEPAMGWQTYSPQDPQAAYMVALLTCVSSPNQAEEWLELAARLDPVYQPGLSAYRLALGQADLSADPAYRLTLVGRWLASQGEWDLSETVFAAAVDASPEYAEARAFLGQARVVLGKNGLADIQAAVALNPRSAMARALLAAHEAESGDYAAALENMNAAVEAEPQQVVWRIELANFTAAEGDLQSAASLFAAARTIAVEDPLVWEATANFSYTYAYDLRVLGLPAARHLILLAPQQPSGYTLAGAILLSLGDIHGAERFLQQALLVEPDYAPAHFHLGQVYLQRSRMGPARDHLRLAEALDKYGGTAQAARRLLEKYFGEG